MMKRRSAGAEVSGAGEREEKTPTACADELEEGVQPARKRARCTIEALMLSREYTVEQEVATKILLLASKRLAERAAAAPAPSRWLQALQHLSHHRRHGCA